METKYYKWFRVYFKVEGTKCEKVMAWTHEYGIVRGWASVMAWEQGYEITEKQYRRAKLLIILKLQQNV